MFFINTWIVLSWLLIDQEKANIEEYLKAEKVDDCANILSREDVD